MFPGVISVVATVTYRALAASCKEFNDHDQLRAGGKVQQHSFMRAAATLSQ